MKSYVSKLVLASLVVAGSVFANGNFKKYKMAQAQNKFRAIELYGKDKRTQAERNELAKLSHEWAARELAAYQANRDSASVSFADYKKKNLNDKIRATELAAKMNRTAAEQAELEQLGHAWAVREKAVYNQKQQKTVKKAGAAEKKHFIKKMAKRSENSVKKNKTV